MGIKPLDPLMERRAQEAARTYVAKTAAQQLNLAVRIAVTCAALLACMLRSTTATCLHAKESGSGD